MFYLKDISLLRKGVAGNSGAPGQKGEVGYPGPFVSNLNFSAYEGMDAPKRITLVSFPHLVFSHHFLRERKDQGDQGLWYGFNY